MNKYISGKQCFLPAVMLPFTVAGFCFDRQASQLLIMVSISLFALIALIGNFLVSYVVMNYDKLPPDKRKGLFKGGVQKNRNFNSLYYSLHAASIFITAVTGFTWVAIIWLTYVIFMTISREMLIEIYEDNKN